MGHNTIETLPNNLQPIGASSICDIAQCYGLAEEWLAVPDDDLFSIWSLCGDHDTEYRERNATDSD